MKKQFKYFLNQSGQGLVEYAILLLLTITLVIGGVELAATAMASNKATEAAKAGVNEYVVVNEKRLNLQTKLQRAIDRSSDIDNTYLIELDTLTTNVHLDNIANGDNNYLWTNYDGCFSNSINCNTGIDLVGTPTDPIEIEVLKIDTIDGIGNNDGTVDDYELYQAVVGHEETEILGVNFDILSAIAGIDRSTLDDDEKYYKALMLFDHIQLSMLPLDPRIDLSKSVPLLGDHDVALMSKPSCDTTDPDNILYFNGFDGEDLDVDDDGVPDGIAHQQIGTVKYPAVYLFNPLPINARSCTGVDVPRDNTNLISILVNGYGREGQLDYVKGMPKLHQAYYSQYQSVCFNASQEYVACGSSEDNANYLKPPGKLCISSASNPTIDSCPGLDSIDTSYFDTVDNDYITGYYFWGKANESDPAVNGRFKWVYNELPKFRPSFQLLCNGDKVYDDESGEYLTGADCRDTFDNYDDVDEETQIHSIEVNVRYRSVFESFLAFGMHQLQDDSGFGLANYFYDPANLRSLGLSDISGSIVGSELGPKQENGLPTVKPFKDFRGCYNVDVASNQVSACN